MRPERLYLWDILEAIEDIKRFTSGLDLDRFLTDKETRYAVVFALVMLGEAAAHVSPELQQRYPEIPWQDMIGQRNVIAHGYFALLWEDVWETAVRDVPALRPQIAAILTDEFGDSVDLDDALS